MDRMFGQILGDTLPVPSFGPTAFPALNIREDAEAFHVEAELPGLKMSDLEILVLGRELTIKGRRAASNVEGATYHRQERASGEFSRTVRLPVPIDSEKVAAALKDGVLAVTLPKTPEAKPRRIEITTSGK
jgi:HSP20 family protein